MRPFRTATPHRGKEWLFRALLHLVDPDVYPPVAANEEPAHAAKPGRVHFLRRMKEDLVDFDGVTRLFKGRRAANETVPLNPTEGDFYAQALDLVDRFFPANAVPLGRMVYGKRAASSLYALAETLKRRRDGLKPDDVGLSTGTRRRTAGLRRDGLEREHVSPGSEQVPFPGWHYPIHGTIYTCLRSSLVSLWKQWTTHDE